MSEASEASEARVASELIAASQLIAAVLTLAPGTPAEVVRRYREVSELLHKDRVDLAQVLVNLDHILGEPPAQKAAQEAEGCEPE